MKRLVIPILCAAALMAPSAPLHAQAKQPPPPAVGQADPFAKFLFPPELVMQHQGEIGLQESQRDALQAAIQEAQGTVVKVQWALTREAETLTKQLDSPNLVEKDVLATVDRILTFERDMKRAQVTLMVRIKNTLTPAQQARLRALR